MSSPVAKVHDDTPMVLTVAGISKAFGSTLAVQQFDVEAKSRECIALVGGNGSGKTTVLKIVAGVLRPDSGSVVFDGVTLGDGNPKRSRNAGIEMVYQHSGHCPNASVLENLFLGRELSGRSGFVNLSQMKSLSREMIERLRLPLPNLNAKVRELSGGQQKAVAICRAMLANPRLLLLDEATANLGVREQQVVMLAFQQLKDRGIGFVFSTHSPDEVMAFADRILVMRRGKLSEDRGVNGLSRSDLAMMMSG